MKLRCKYNTISFKIFRYIKNIRLKFKQILISTIHSISIFTNRVKFTVLHFLLISINFSQNGNIRHWDKNLSLYPDTAKKYYLCSRISQTDNDVADNINNTANL